MGQHVIGMRVQGEMGRFLDVFDDAAFDALIDSLGGDLPAGFVAWHLDSHEWAGNSRKAAKIGAHPIITRQYGRDDAVQLEPFGMLSSQPVRAADWLTRAAGRKEAGD